MNSDLNEKFKEFHRNQAEMDRYMARQNKLKREIEQLIIKQKLVGKKFSVGDRFISYKKMKTTTGFTQAYIAQCLEDLFIDDPREAEAILNYFLDNRQTKSRFGLEIRKKKREL